MQITLRDYQAESVERLRQGMRDGHRCQILMSPTGSGKAVIAAYMLQEAQRKMSRACIIVDRVSLVDQLSDMLLHYGVPHGVTQAGHARRAPHERIQVCSAQTLEAREYFPGMLDLVLHDEAHATRKLLMEFFKSTKAKVVGLTATAFTKGLGQVYTNIVNVTTTNRLTAEGWLVPMKVYAAKSPDMTGAKIIAGEWSDSELESRGMKLVGDVVQEWISKTRLHFGGAVKSICFSSTVAHGEEICRQFNACGYRWEQISYKDSNDTRRRELIAEFRRPDSSIIGLVSVDALSRGFDVPDVKCAILARPFRKSLSGHIQTLGRVLRPAPGKEFALILDHANNTLRFYKQTQKIFEHGLDKLDDDDPVEVAQKEPTEKVRKELTCSCGFLLTPGAPVCPGCGKERARRSLVEMQPGELVEFNPKAKQDEREKGAFQPWTADKDYTWRQLSGEGMQRKRGDESAAKRWALAHYKALYNEWPSTPFDGSLPPMTDIPLRSRVTAQTIRWAHSPFPRKRA